MEPRHLSEAFEHVARCDHFCVGVVGEYTDDELDAAEQLLISKQNDIVMQEDHESEQQYEILDRALNLIEHERMNRRTHAKNQVQR